MEQKGENAPKGIPKIPFGGFTLPVSAKHASWFTPYRNPFRLDKVQT
jgi:hypothetical protein